MGFFIWIIKQLDRVPWNIGLLILLMIIGIYLSIKIRFIHLRGMVHLFKHKAGVPAIADKSAEELSPSQALLIALGGTIGVGNIAGVAISIILAGPGCIFWMWITTLFAGVLKLASVILAIEFRQSLPGKILAGPMVTLKYGLNMPKLASLFAIFAIISSIGLGGMNQANFFLVGVNHVFSLWGTVPFRFIATFVGFFLSLSIAWILFGGVSRIYRVLVWVVPIMIGTYVFFSFFILLAHIEKLPSVFMLIIKSAWQLESAVGGAFAYSFGIIVERGLFLSLSSNEAGLGSSSIIHASVTTTTHPTRQGIIATTETILDTLIINTLTALVIITFGSLELTSVDGYPQAIHLVSLAFQEGIQEFLGQSAYYLANLIIGMCMILFSFSSLLTWSFYGRRSMEFLTKNKEFLFIYQIGYVLFIFIGTTIPLHTIWIFLSVSSTLMIIPNLISILLLSKLIHKRVEDYVKHLKTSK